MVPCLNAQDTLQRKRVTPHVWLTLFDNSRVDGFIYETKDSSVVISNTNLIENYLNGNYSVIDLNIDNIKNLSYRNRNNVFIGMAMGGLTGILIGFPVGYLQGDDPPCEGGWWCVEHSAESKGFAGAFSGFMIGTGAGAFFGSVIRFSVPLGNYQNYSKYKMMLEKKSVRSKYLKEL